MSPQSAATEASTLSLSSRTEVLWTRLTTHSRVKPQLLLEQIRTGPVGFTFRLSRCSFHLFLNVMKRPDRRNPRSQSSLLSQSFAAKRWSERCRCMLAIYYPTGLLTRQFYLLCSILFQGKHLNLEGLQLKIISILCMKIW